MGPLTKEEAGVHEALDPRLPREPVAQAVAQPWRPPGPAEHPAMSTFWALLSPCFPIKSQGTV